MVELYLTGRIRVSATYLAHGPPTCVSKLQCDHQRTQSKQSRAAEVRFRVIEQRRTLKRNPDLSSSDQYHRSCHELCIRRQWNVHTRAVSLNASSPTCWVFLDKASQASVAHSLHWQDYCATDGSFGSTKPETCHEASQLEVPPLRNGLIDRRPCLDLATVLAK